MSKQLRELQLNGTTKPDIVDRVAVFLQKKVMHTQGQLVVTYGRVCESKGLTSDHYSDTVSQKLWCFTAKARPTITSQEMDACLLQVPIMKHLESTAVYLDRLLDWLNEKTGVRTRSCAKAVRDSIDHAVTFH